MAIIKHKKNKFPLIISWVIGATYYKLAVPKYSSAREKHWWREGSGFITMLRCNIISMFFITTPSDE